MAPSTQWKENIDSGEAARLEKYAEALHAIQKKRDAQGPSRRALHPKGHLGLKAEFTVLPDLPDYAKVGIFSQPGTYQAYARFSNGGSAVNDDRQGGTRAIALKLLGVGGKKIIHGLEDAPTQDFLLIGSAALPFKNADEFVPFVTNIGKPWIGLPTVIFKIGLGRTLDILKKMKAGAKHPTISLATMRYYSAAPIQFGPYAVHYRLSPHEVDAPGAQPGQTPNYLAEDLSARIKREPLVFDFAVQFFVDETRTPIEDVSVEWKEDISPFVTLGRLTISPQDPDSAPGRKLYEFIEKLSFDIWHAPVEFRPLGNIMRARRVAYKVSSKERQALPEPDGSEKFE
jgi:hypothetical protein